MNMSFDYLAKDGKVKFNCLASCHTYLNLSTAKHMIVRRIDKILGDLFYFPSTQYPELTPKENFPVNVLPKLLRLSFKIRSNLLIFV